MLCERGAVGGVDVRGGAPGTRETDSLRPGTMGQQVHAVLLTGGSAFGLDAATGVMRWCEEHGVGLRFAGQVIPIVPAAVLFDLNAGRGDVRPDAASGYAAAAAAKGGRVAEGSVGAGTGARVAKALGMAGASKGGVGTASEATDSGLIVGVIVAVNAVGEIVDSRDGSVVAGPRGADGRFVDTLTLLREGRTGPPLSATNTTLAVVATNARLTKEQTNRLATVAHDGFARAIRPVHTLSDGDTVFALSTGEQELSDAGELRALEALEALTAVAVERAIVKAVRLSNK